MNMNNQLNLNESQQFEFNQQQFNNLLTLSKSGNKNNFNKKEYQNQCMRSLIMIIMTVLIDMGSVFNQNNIQSFIKILLTILFQIQIGQKLQKIKYQIVKNSKDYINEISNVQIMILMCITFNKLISVVFYQIQGNLHELGHIFMFYQLLEVLKIKQFFITSMPKLICYSINLFFAALLILINIINTQSFVNLVLIQALSVATICIYLLDVYLDSTQNKQVDELEFRTSASYSTMHDLRNYLYTSIISVKDTQVQNRTELIKYRKELYQVIQTDIQVLEQVKFLQGLELIFNDNQSLNMEHIKTKELFHWVNRKLKLWMRNKNWKIYSELNKYTIESVTVDRNLLKVLMVTLVQEMASVQLTELEIRWSNLNLFQEETQPQSHLESNILRIDISSKNLTEDNVTKVLKQIQENLMIKKIIDYIRLNTKDIIIEVLQSKLGLALILTHRQKRAEEYVRLMACESLHSALNHSDFSIFEEFIKDESKHSEMIQNDDMHMNSLDITSIDIENKSTISNDKNNEENANRNMFLLELDNKYSLKHNSKIISSNDKNQNQQLTAKESIKNANAMCPDNSSTIIENIVININRNSCSDNSLNIDQSSPSSNEQHVSSDVRPILKTLFINVDDETNILKMHQRIFSKCLMEINCVRSGEEFNQVINQMTQDEWFNDKTIIALIDYKLNGEQGDQVIQNARVLLDQIKNVKFTMNFIIVSSTEDKNVIEKLNQLNILKIYQKPLKKSNVEEINNLFMNTRKPKRNSADINELNLKNIELKTNQSI